MGAALGLGGAPLSGRFGPVAPARFEAVLDTAFSLGITFFDTAAKYAGGEAEKLLGQYLSRRPRSAYTICTKVPVTDSASATRAAVQASLDRLGCGVLDVVLLHDPDDVPDAVLQANLRALTGVRDEGSTRAIGVGIGDVDVLLRAADLADIDCILLSGRYTLLDQSADRRLLPLCQERGIRVILGSVFNSGILASGPRLGARYEYDDHVPPDVRRRAEALADLCDRHGVALPAAAMAYAARHPAISLILVGTTDPDHLAADHKMSTMEIPAAFWSELTASGLVEP